MRLTLRRCTKVIVIFLLVLFAFFLILHTDAKLFSTSSLPEKKNQHKHGGVANSSLKTLHKRYERSLTSIRNQTDAAKDVGNPLQLHDIMISIKTTQKYHKTRMKILVDTWIKNARNETYIFTDEDDEWLQSQLPENHVINTRCPKDHNRKSLCCKMATEFDTFIILKKKWFCHVDDDTYINIPQLLSLLRKYNHTSDWYLGKPSLQHPIEIVDRQHPGQMLAFWFATGGAGFCISRALALKMVPHAGGGRLMRVGEQIRLPDDCTIGFVINSMLRKELTVIAEFHSHLEPLWKISLQTLKYQITVSYKLGQDRINVVRIPEFIEHQDPTRFLAVHCHLHSMTKECLGNR